MDEPEIDESDPVERLFRAGARALRMCGFGPDNGWSIEVANAFFIDCACCLFWRGVFMGAGWAAIAALAFAATTGDWA